MRNNIPVILSGAIPRTRHLFKLALICNYASSMKFSQDEKERQLYDEYVQMMSDILIKNDSIRAVHDLCTKRQLIMACSLEDYCKQLVEQYLCIDEHMGSVSFVYKSDTASFRKIQGIIQDYVLTTQNDLFECVNDLAMASPKEGKMVIMEADKLEDLEDALVFCNGQAQIVGDFGSCSEMGRIKQQNPDMSDSQCEKVLFDQFKYYKFFQELSREAQDLICSYGGGVYTVCEYNKASMLDFNEQTILKGTEDIVPSIKKEYGYTITAEEGQMLLDEIGAANKKITNYTKETIKKEFFSAFDKKSLDITDVNNKRLFTINSIKVFHNDKIRFHRDL